MPNKIICFDMDGTIVNLYNFPDWKQYLEAEDPTPYREAEPLCDMNALSDIVYDLIDAGWEIRIISWLSKNSSNYYKTKVREAKLDWLEKYGFPYDVCHLVQYGTTKADCIRHCQCPAILVDDNARVRSGWHMGETIDPAEGLLEQLRALLQNRMEAILNAG